MRQIQTLIASLLAMLLMCAGMNESYAQSQYRRQSNNNGHKNNSEYRPAPNSKPANKPANKPAGKPDNVNKPGNPWKPKGTPPAGHSKPKPNNVGNTGVKPRPSAHFSGYYTKTLPRDAKIIHRGSHDYYYSAGRYYKYVNNVYVVSRPPVGAIIAKSILNGLLKLTDYVVKDAYGKNQRYYTDDDGVYYVKSGNNYIVVDPPIGAILYELPYGFEEVTINGTKYYQVDDNFYELVYNGPQDYYFRVVGTLGR